MSFPPHAYVGCTLCYPNWQAGFDKTLTAYSDWGITHNWLSWGTSSRLAVGDEAAVGTAELADTQHCRRRTKLMK